MHNYDKKNRGTGVYIFWLIMLFLASTLTIIVLYSFFPETISLEKLFARFHTVSRMFKDSEEPEESDLQNKQSENSQYIEWKNLENTPSSTRTDDANNVTNSDTIETHGFLEEDDTVSSDDFASDAQDNIDVIEKPPKKNKYSILKGARITNESKFLTKDGRRFLAGTLKLQGHFPGDFYVAGIDFDVSIPVEVFVDIGWNDLMSFSKLEKLNSTKGMLSQSIPVPPLEIIRIAVKEKGPKTQSKETMNNVVMTIKEFTRSMLMDTGAIDIVSNAQQRLAASYVAHGYSNVVLTSQ